MSYILSILIPTKNRLRYLKGSLECINRIESADIEVIIQDNSDNWIDVRECVSAFHNNNFKYFHQEGKLSQTENSELAAEKATGEFVCYIGDDDTICESLLDLARCMSRFNIDSAVYGIANYNWPDLLKEKPNLNACTYRDIKELRIEVLDPYKNLLQALRGGMLNIKDLPRVYHGIVSKRLLEQVKTNAGSYFPGPSPDMANATACALYARNLIRVNLPMIIDGYGKSSAGGMGQRKLHTGTLKGNFQLKDDVEELWDSRIPKLWMQDTIWPNSAIKSLEACGQGELAMKLNVYPVYCDTFLHNRDSMQSIRECGLTPMGYIRSFGCFINKCVRKVRSELRQNEYVETVLKDAISIEKVFELQNKINSKYNLEQEFERALHDTFE